MADPLDSLVDEASISQSRRDGDKRLATLTQSQVNQLRHDCKHDLFFLAYGVLGYTRLSPKLHGNLCSWMMRHRDKRFRQILLPRGHFKSTICTISDSIRLALPIESDYWPESLGPDIRILVAHETMGMAGKFLYEITQHFLSNPMLMALFPECVPSPKKQRINKSELELPRSERWGEATYTTMGSGAAGQGYHFNFLKLDDIIGENARDSKAEMDSAKLWIDGIRAFFSTFTRDALDNIGTRYLFDDVYAHIQQAYGTELFKYIRGAEEIVDGKKQPIFPEEHTEKEFEVLKKNKLVWSTQWANDPALGSTDFNPAWKRYFNWNGPTTVRRRILGTASIEHTQTRDMDIVFLIDPAMTGKAGFVVTGMDSTGNICTLEALKDEWLPTDLTDLVFKMVHKWHPRLVAVEKVLFSAVFENYWKEAMKNRGVHFRVEAIPTGNKEKEARVRGLSNYFAAGQIYFHPDQKALIQEFDQFGATDDYHMLDALSMGPKVWRKGVDTKWLTDIQQANDVIFSSESGRHPIGGY
jgi:predicted phage terminase large subunit-like protein